MLYNYITFYLTDYVLPSTFHWNKMIVSDLLLVAESEEKIS